MDTSILIIHFGDVKGTKKSLKSVYKSDLKNIKYEILILENTPKTDNSNHFKNLPNLKYIKTNKNNFCYALNLGVKKAKGEFVVLLNQNIKVHPDWLKELIQSVQKNPKIGGVMSKIIHNKTKKIVSKGIKQLSNYYFKDIDINKPDTKDSNEKSIAAASGCTVLYRKKALEQIGGFDNDFNLYFEDAEVGYRMRDAGWEIILNPKSIIFHEPHSTSPTAYVPWYFCNRNRFMFIAKRNPEDFAKQIKKSQPYKHKQEKALYKFIHDGIYKLFKEQDKKTIESELPKILKEMTKIYPIEKIQNLINEIELVFKLRKPKICFYDHALHFHGGGQKYGLTIAEKIQNDYDITLIGNKKVKIEDLEKWYNLKLNKCKVETVEIMINENDPLINPTLAEEMPINPFSPVEDMIMDYDLLINVNMTPHVNCLSNKSIFLCHFPDGKRKNHFYVDNYDHIIANSKYTSGWIKKLWNLEANDIIYPPVDMKNTNKVEKENIILSVSRFEESGTKKQLDMAQIFTAICNSNKLVAKNWKLILAGGTSPNNSYIKKIKEFSKAQNCKIQIKTNLSNTELKDLYARSKIFWHACGLHEHPSKNPQRIEHFGMTTVEAMQNKCVPIVINGGGQKEIINHSKNGYRFNNPNQLKKFTLKLIRNPKLIEHLSKTAYNDSSKFNKTIFQNKFQTLIKQIMSDLMDKNNFVPEVHKIPKFPISF